MIQRLKNLSPAFFLIVAMALLATFNFQKPRILVLHSYDPGYAWTRDVDVGLKRVLDKQIGLNVRWHYMDTKRHPAKDFRAKAGVIAKQVIDSWRPALVIAIDDDAQSYAAKDYANTPGIYLVFAGVNGEITPYGYDTAPNVSGIIERKPLHALKETLLLIAQKNQYPERLKIVHIGDTSDSVMADEMAMREFDWSPLVRLDSRLVEDFAQWQQAVWQANETADILITTNYRKLSRSSNDKTLVPPEEVVKWTEENSRRPIIGTNGFFVEEGGAIAVGASGYEQGEIAAKLAIDFLQGNLKWGTKRIVTPKQFVLFIRSKEVEKRSLKIPALHEAFAYALGNYISE